MNYTFIIIYMASKITQRMGTMKTQMRLLRSIIKPIFMVQMTVHVKSLAIFIMAMLLL